MSMQLGRGSLADVLCHTIMEVASQSAPYRDRGLPETIKFCQDAMEVVVARMFHKHQFFNVNCCVSFEIAHLELCVNDFYTESQPCRGLVLKVK